MAHKCEVAFCGHDATTKLVHASKTAWYCKKHIKVVMKKIKK